MTELAVATLAADLEGALALGSRALAWAASERRPMLASASFESRALVLGALQREGTLRTRSPARFDAEIARRRSTGTEAQLDGAVLYHALALPRVDALFSDATARTLLNRNLRAILRGYAAAGVPLRYFGTEVLALLGHPVALVGYEQVASGAVLIEVFLGVENPCVVRSALKRAAPRALSALLGALPEPHELLAAVVRGVLSNLGATPVDVAASLPQVPPFRLHFESPQLVALPIPLGVVEATLVPRPQLTGDLLVGTAALTEVEALAEATLDRGGTLSDALLSPLKGAPLDGALPADLLSALLAAVLETKVVPRQSPG